MYTFNGRVRYSEVGADGELTLEALMDYFQDCATFHSEEVGFGVEYLMKEKKGWVLLSWQIEIKRYPKFGEKIAVSTKAYDFKRSFGYRNLMMQDENGEYVALANSVWLYMDLEKMMPDRVEQAQVDAYTLEEKFSMDYPPTKIKLPEVVVEEGKPIVIGSHQIDTNGHVNNVEYLRMACEAVGKVPKTHNFRAEYKKSAMLGDTVYPKIYREATKETVALCTEDGKIFATIEWKQ